MLSTQTKGWVGTGALKYSPAMADSKKATDKQHWACDSKDNPLGPGPSNWILFLTTTYTCCTTLLHYEHCKYNVEFPVI